MSEICSRCGSLCADSTIYPCAACMQEIERELPVPSTTLSRAEYDRLLNIEGEYQRLRAENLKLEQQYANRGELMNMYVDGLIELSEAMLTPEQFRERAHSILAMQNPAIARAKGG